MPKIFLCYRRADSKWPTQWIYKDLVDHFGSEAVVFDIDTIPLGEDFREYINQEVSKCDILLAVIGDRWLEILKQRLDQPNDFIRIEIQAALERGIPVVPVLVGEKSVPNEKDLPPKLANLSYKQAAEVRAGADLQLHLKRLVDGLDRLLSNRKTKKDLRLDKGGKESKFIQEKEISSAIRTPFLTNKMFATPKSSVSDRDIKGVKPKDLPQRGDIIKCENCHSAFKFLDEIPVVNNQISCLKCKKNIDVMTYDREGLHSNIVDLLKKFKKRKTANGINTKKNLKNLPQRGDIIKCENCHSTFKFLDEIPVVNNQISCPKCKKNIDVA